MPVTALHLTTSNTDVSQSSYTTASISPSANKLILVAVASNHATTLPNTPTLSGNGLTYVEVATVTFDTIATPTARLTLFRALGASPSAGAITIDFAAQNQSRCLWSVNEFGNVDTTGANGAGAVVQSATNRSNSQNSPFTVTLAAFASADNATYGAIQKRVAENVTAGTGFTELGEVDVVWATETEWRNDNDTSVDWTYATAGAIVAGIAIEIKLAVAVTAKGLPFMWA